MMTDQEISDLVCREMCFTKDDPEHHFDCAMELCRVVERITLRDREDRTFLLPEDAEEVASAVAAEVLHHIDTMYPEMWKAVAKNARLSIRNTIKGQTGRMMRAMVKLLSEVAPQDKSR